MSDDAVYRQFQLSNAQGSRVVLSELGACIRELHCRDKNGDLADIVLGFDTDQEYLSDHCYMGTVVGPYANRIKNARLHLAGQCYQLSQNEGLHTLHGGAAGLHHRHWQGRYGDMQSADDHGGVSFRLQNRAGLGGFPGNVDIEASYRLDDDNRLWFECRATTDQRTVINLAQHSYFNLSGHASGSALNCYLQLDADYITETDNELLPTGKFVEVAGTPVDFLRSRCLGARVDADHPLMRACSGYDHNFVIRQYLQNPGQLAPVARAVDPVSGRSLRVWSNQPGVQLYSGNHIPPALTGKRGAVYGPRQGFCLETQRFPDSANHRHFPEATLVPGQVYRAVTCFQLACQ